MKLQNFTQAFALQKAAEFALLAACMTAVMFIGSRIENSDEWGVLTGGAADLVTSLLAGVGAAYAFFLFTLYPIVTYVVVASVRKFGSGSARRALPLASAIASVAYVTFWIVLLQFPFSFVPFGIVTIIMASFIFVTSVKWYPSVAIDSTAAP
jgi:hypothetical protein